MKALKILFDIVEDYVPAVLLGLTTLIVLVDVVGRYVFRHPFIGVSELALIAVVWIVFLGAIGVMRRREHIALELVIERLPPRGQAILDAIVHLILTTILGTLVYLSLKFVTSTIFSNLLVTGLSRRFMATSVVIMAGIMLLIVLHRTYRAVRGIFNAEYRRDWSETDSSADAPPTI